MKMTPHISAVSLGMALLLASMSTWVSGQTTYSPHSRFGFGELHSGAGIPQFGMGQMGAAWMDRHHLNTRNPAAAGFLTRTTFAGGFQLRSEQIMEGDRATQGEIGGLTQVSFALKKAGGKGAFTFGLQPWSTTGYNVSQIRTDDTADEYQIAYEGEGGLTQAHMGYARKWEGTKFKRFFAPDGTLQDSVRIIAHGTSFGVRMEQRFGELRRARTIDIANPIFLDTRVETEETHRSLGLSVGFGHERLLGTRFDKDRKLVTSTLLRLGGMAALGRQHTLARNNQWSSWQTLSTGPIEIDSAFASQEAFDIELPLSWTLGLEIERNTKDGLRFRLGVEWEQTAWSELGTEWLDPGAVFADKSTLAFGGALTPRGLDDANSIWQRSTYQIGWRQTEGYIALDQELLNANTWSVGWSLPMRGSRSGSSFNLALNWSSLQAGTSDLGLREQGFGAMAGFTLHPFFKNQWLVTRKYD